MTNSFLKLVSIGLLVLLTSCLNPDFVSTNSSRLYPAAPGDEPFLLVRVVNDSAATLDVPVAYDDGTNPVPFVFRDLTPEHREVGVLLDWPVTRVTIGDLANPGAPAILASLPNGINFAIPMGLAPLQAGVDFQRGDAIVYTFTSDSRNPAAIQVSVGRIDGSTQQGPFGRADTFRTVRQVLQLNEVLTENNANP